jgi:hypothetical protein
MSRNVLLRDLLTNVEALQRCVTYVTNCQSESTERSTSVLEQRPAMTEAETTLNSSQNYAESLPDFVRDNTMAADPNRGHSLVTNFSNPTQLCHCVWWKAMVDDNLVRLHRSRPCLF